MFLSFIERCRTSHLHNEYNSKNKRVPQNLLSPEFAVTLAFTLFVLKCEAGHMLRCKHFYIRVPRNSCSHLHFFKLAYLLHIQNLMNTLH